MSWHGARQLLGAFRSTEFGTIVVFLFLAAMCFTFVQLANEVGEGETNAFDKAVMLAMRSSQSVDDPIGPEWFEEAVRDVTSLGSTTVLMTISLALAGFLAITGARTTAMLMCISFGGGTVLVRLLKEIFSRARPDLVPHAAQVFSTSFPSGHATMSAITYLTTGVLLGRMHGTRTTKLYILGVAIALTILVGASRVYLGVHWPTDVLAGWCLGAGWSMGCWAILTRLERSEAATAENSVSKGFD